MHGKNKKSEYMEISKKNISPDGLPAAWAYRSPGSLLVKAVDELPNELNLHL